MNNEVNQLEEFLLNVSGQHVLRTKSMVISQLCLPSPSLCPLQPTQAHLQQQLAWWSKFRQQAKTNNPR